VNSHGNPPAKIFPPHRFVRESENPRRRADAGSTASTPKPNQLPVKEQKNKYFATGRVETEGEEKVAAQKMKTYQPPFS
jgi:hypothetical protein